MIAWKTVSFPKKGIGRSLSKVYTLASEASSNPRAVTIVTGRHRPRRVAKPSNEENKVFS